LPSAAAGESHIFKATPKNHCDFGELRQAEERSDAAISFFFKHQTLFFERSLSHLLTFSPSHFPTFSLSHLLTFPLVYRHKKSLTLLGKRKAYINQTAAAALSARLNPRSRFADRHFWQVF